MLTVTNQRIGPSTTEDGVTYNRNNYIRLNGNIGLKYEDNSNPSLSTYSVSIWFKLETYPWEVGKDQMLFQFGPTGFYCSLLRQSRADCRSDSGGQLIMNGLPIINQWHMLILKSKSDHCQAQMRDLGNDVIASEAQGTFFPFGTSTLTFSQIHIGINKNERSDYFQGNLRNFKLFSAYYNDKQLRNIQFIDVYPFTELLVSLVMDSPTNLFSNVYRNQAQAVGGSFSDKIEEDFDYSGSWWCSGSEPVFPTFLKFENSLRISSYPLPGKTTSNGETTVKIWFLRNYEVIDTQDETLFEHINVLRLQFQSSSYDDLSILRPSNPNGGSVQALFNKWYYLQVFQNGGQMQYFLADRKGQTLQAITSVNQGRPGNSAEAIIGQSFRGFIRGIRYQSGFQLFEVTKFLEAMDRDSSTLMYFLFSFEFSDEGNKLISLTNQNDNQIQINSQNPVYQHHYYFDIDSTETVGTVDEQVQFDGVTCKDQKKKLYMPYQYSYAQNDVAVEYTLTNFTIEFWMKKPRGQTRDSTIMTISERGNNWNQYLTIKQQRSVLSCYPFYSSQNIREPMKVVYDDYDAEIQTWIHISCSYFFQNPSKAILRGDMKLQATNYVYDKETNIGLLIPRDIYTLTIGNDPTNLDDGLRQTYYAEIRFWNYYRTVTQVVNSQFHQLYIKDELEGLLSYIKLFNGGFTRANEIDFVKFNQTNNVIELTQTEWITDSDLIVCPQYTFIDSSESNCFRDGISQLIITQIRNDSNYVITPLFSYFTNNLIRDNIDTLYDFQWSVVLVNTPFNNSDRLNFRNLVESQATSSQLFLPMNQVAQNPGSYWLEVEIQDKQRNQQKFEAQIRFKTLNCLEIYDKETEKSFLFSDITVTRGQSDFFLYFVYKECRDYYFQPQRLEITFENNLIRFTNDDINFGDNSIRLTASNQEKLPLNEYFYMRVKGLWSKPFTNTDIIEMPLVYGLRFITFLSLNLRANSPLVREGLELKMSIEGSEVVNLSDRDEDRDDKTYTYKWNCPPGFLDDECKKQSNKDLILYSNQFALANITYWQPFEISVTAYTNFLQGNGEKSITKAMKLIRIPIAPEIEFLQPEIPFSNQVNAFTVLVTNIENSEEVEQYLQVKWAIQPNIGQEYLPNGNNRKQYVITEGGLSEGQIYNITAYLVYAPEQTTIWKESRQFQVPINPRGGDLSITPGSGGVAFLTDFTITPFNWQIQSGPATYEFFYKDQYGNRILLVRMNEGSMTSKIPETNMIILRITDSRGAYSEQFKPFTVNKEGNLQRQTIEQLLSVSESLATSSYGSYQFVQQAQLFSSTLNIVEDQMDEDGISTSKKAYSTITKKFQEFSTNIGLLGDGNAQQYFLQSSISQYAQLTNSSKLFDFRTSQQIQDSIYNMVTRSDLLSKFQTDRNFNLNLLQIQSNLLFNLKIKEIQGQLSPEDDSQSQITSKMRKILYEFEKFWAAKTYESQITEFDVPYLIVKIYKRSRLESQKSDFLGDVKRQIYYTFPFSTAREPTDRQSVSFIGFVINGFLGNNEYTNQTAISNSSIYFAYRDQDGNYLDNTVVEDKIQMNYKFQYDSEEFFNREKFTCGYINIGQPYWINSSCSHFEDIEYNFFNCSCNHMSFYSVIEDNFDIDINIRVNLQLQNWVAIITFIYVILVFIIGVIHTYTRDNHDYHSVYEQEEKSGGHLTNGDSINIITFAFRRKVLFMNYHESLKQRVFYKFLLMLVHPLFELEFKWDPTFPRFYRFMLLFFRLMVDMVICYFFFHAYKSFDDMSTSKGMQFVFTIIYVIILSLLFLPIPDFLTGMFKSKFYISFESAGNKGSDFDEIKPQKQNAKQFDRVYVDPSLPIKLLFLINAVPGKDILQQHKQKIPFGSGNPSKVGEIIQQLNFSMNSQVDEEEEEEEEEDEEREQKQELAVSPSQQVRRDAFEKVESIPRQENLNQSPNRQQNRSRQDNSAANFSNFQDVPSNEEDVAVLRSVERSNTEQKIVDEPIDHQQIQMVFDNKQIQQPVQNKRNSNMKQRSNVQVQQIEEVKSEYSQSYQEENYDDDDVNDSDYQNEGGTKEQGPPQKDGNIINWDGKRQQNESQAQQNEQAQEDDDKSSINTNEFILDRKELVQENTCCNKFLFFILYVITFGLFAAIIVDFIRNKQYETEAKENYVWVIIFFLSQLVGLFITNYIALAICACSVFSCCKRKKVCLYKTMRSCLTIYEDYKYVVQFTVKNQ